MSNNYFIFKQFRINQQDAAMKVGTDGVLLGAWAELDGTERRMLDIGTGTGVIALMAAQRAPQARIDAVEIDENAARQARQNAEASPWADRLQVYNASVQNFARDAAERYDLILSNPPFFVDSLKAPDAARSAARHTDTLSFDDLAAAADRLLTPAGRFAAIYPTEEAAVFQRVAGGYGLFPCRRLQVKSTPQGAFKRTLTEFSRRETAIAEEELTIETAPLRYTAEYIALTRDFYLKF
jgi:tRNA1Val (adenine37-N6)-methyltransferase